MFDQPPVGRPFEELAARFFPGVELRAPLPGNAGFYRTGLALAELSWDAPGDLARRALTRGVRGQVAACRVRAALRSASHAQAVSKVVPSRISRASGTWM